MESNHNGGDILHDLDHLLRVYQDGRVERLELAPPVPASPDPLTGVESKDIEIFPDRGVGARLFRPNPVRCPAKKKFPVLVFYHGGAFCVQSTFGALYHNYLNNLAGQGQVLIISIEYRLAPEHPVPTCYDDCGDALNWVTSHGVSHLLGSSFNPEPWLMDNADFSSIFLAGDSAGGNIAHQIALRVGNKGLANNSIHQVNGIILSHPYFWGKDRIGNEVAKLNGLPNPNPNIVDYIWKVVCPKTSGSDDPWINPTQDPQLGKLGCKRVLVFVAENDVLRDRGWLYKEALEKSGWPGKVQVVESLGENHVFHLYNPSCANAADVMTKVVDFINLSSSNVEA